MTTVSFEYWSVCIERGYACNCHSTSQVMQGFDIDVWENEI